MKPKLKRVVRTEFRSLLASVAPQFEFMRALTGELAGLDQYHWRASDATSLYLMYQPDPRHDAFWVEAALSSKHQWPDFSVPGLPTDPPINGELRFRISRLWAPKENFFAWWIGANVRAIKKQGGSEPMQDEKEQLASIPAVMEDCGNRIKEYVLPYFEKAIASDAWK